MNRSLLWQCQSIYMPGPSVPADQGASVKEDPAPVPIEVCGAPGRGLEANSCVQNSHLWLRSCIRAF